MFRVVTERVLYSRIKRILTGIMGTDNLQEKPGKYPVGEKRRYA